jgi:hypothetical protein
MFQIGVSLTDNSGSIIYGHQIFIIKTNSCSFFSHFCFFVIQNKLEHFAKKNFFGLSLIYK